MQVDSVSSKSVSFSLSNEKNITIETGYFAFEANGAVMVKCNETVILVTVCASKEPKPTIDFFPLTVDFEERLYSVGRIPGSYNRREGKANDKAVLAGRLIDRPIRPLFPEGYRNDVQIVATILSSDQKDPTDVLAILGASAALEIAGLPFQGPIGGVRVAVANGQFIVNPTYEELEESPLDLVVAGTEKAILMIEAGATFVKEDVILAGIAFAHEQIKLQINAQKELVQQLGVQKQSFEAPVEDEELTKIVAEIAQADLEKVISSCNAVKKTREAEIDLAYKKVSEYFTSLADDNPLKEKAGLAKDYTKKLEKKLMRKQIMEQGVRVDGRKCNEIRPISSQVGILPRAHGSGLFTRGSTQVLSVVTLGSGSDAKPIDGIWPEREQAYYHNYNFPGYSVGEPKGARSPGRREVGHGALAERALIPALPNKEDFPYVMRVVSDVLSSNGSTSMASTCGSTLALMDAGVPIKAPVAGIAMGLILDNGKCAILSDIQGVEDFLGDMDFKVTGSQEGVTAIQLDLKLPQGISLQILKVALDQALTGRLHILDRMLSTIASPKEQMSPYAPKLITIQVAVEDIGGIIGPSGRNIKKLIEETGVDKIDISDDGLVTIQGSTEAAELAKSKISSATMKILPGEEYRGIIIRKLPIGLFVELSPGKVGLLKQGGPGGGRNRRYGGRGGDNHRDNQEQPSQQPENNFNEFQIDEVVMALVDEIDPKGRINLTSVRKID